MGISTKKFDAMERSTLSKYQIEFGTIEKIKPNENKKKSKY